MYGVSLTRSFDLSLSHFPLYHVCSNVCTFFCTTLNTARTQTVVGQLKNFIAFLLGLCEWCATAIMLWFVLTLVARCLAIAASSRYHFLCGLRQCLPPSLRRAGGGALAETCQDRVVLS